MFFFLFFFFVEKRNQPANAIKATPLFKLTVRFILHAFFLFSRPVYKSQGEGTPNELLAVYFMSSSSLSMQTRNEIQLCMFSHAGLAMELSCNVNVPCSVSIYN